MAGGDDETRKREESTGGARDRVARELAARGVDELTGRYVLGALLGRGGMGEVREARDTRLDREVALKVLRAGRADADDVGRLVREARIGARLDHPNLLPVHDLGVGPDGAVFFTMKRLRGRTLAEVLRGPLPSLHQRLDVFLKVCDAVAYAHHRGVLHRDLKPSNVMIGEFREVWVLDWGLAKQVGEDEVAVRGSASASSGEDGEPLTSGRGAFGTPGWLSPEQARGEHADLDARTDVFSLGCLLYALATGSPPFAGRGDEGVRAVERGVFDPPRKRAPGTSWELEQVILRAMRHRREDRHASVEALRADVAAYLEGQPIPSVSYSAARRLGKWAWRHRRGAAALGALAAAGGAAGLVGLGTWLALVLAARDRALEAERAAELALAQGEVRLAWAEADLGRLDDAVVHLDRARDRLGALGGDPRQAEVARSWLVERYAPPDVVLEGPRGAVALSPDGERLLVAAPDAPIRVFSCATGEVVEVGARVADVVLVAYEGDDLFAVSSPPWSVEATVHDARTGARVTGPLALPAPSALVRRFAAGGVLVLTAPDVGTHAWDLRTGAPVGPPIPGVALQGLSADGRHGVGPDPVVPSSLRVYDLETGRPAASAPASVGFELSSRGDAMVYDAGTRIGVREADGRVRWEGEGQPGTRLWFARGDAEVVIAGSDHRVRILDAATGALRGSRRVLGGPSASIGTAQLAADGRRMVLSLPGEVRIWSLEPTDDTPAIVASERNLTTIDVSPDGLLAATGGWDGHVRLWELGSRARLLDVDLGPAAVRDVAWSPDGGALLVATSDAPPRVLDPATGRARVLPAEGVSRSAGVAWLRGRPAALVDGGRIAVWRADDRPPDVWRGAIGTPWSFVASPDGERLAVVGRVRHEPVLEIWEAATGLLLGTGPIGEAGYHAAWSPDGERLVVGTHAGRILTFAGDLAAPRVTQVRDEALQAVGFSADGATLAVGAYDGQLDLLDADTSAPFASVAVHERSIVDLATLPDGRVVTASGDGRVAWVDPGRAAAIAPSARRVAPDEEPAAADAARWSAIARGQLLRSNWAHALAAFDAAERAGAPPDPVGRARAAFALGRWDEAAAALDRALAEADRPTLRAWRAAVDRARAP